MKNIFFIVIALLLCSCKNEIKSEAVTSEQVEIDASVTKMWSDYTNAHPEFKENPLPESWFFHNNEADANRLGNLVLSGKKQAGSSLYAMYKHYDADLPKVGTKEIITDFNGKALAIIETKKVDTIPFNKISEDYAILDMGTTENPLEKWQKAHWDFFEPAMKDLDKQATEDMLVVCSWFKTIWPEK